MFRQKTLPLHLQPGGRACFDEDVRAFNARISEKEIKRTQGWCRDCFPSRGVLAHRGVNPARFL